MKRCVIVGGGHAAAQLSVSLCQQGWDGSITVLSDELSLPYHRPPLSKDYLSGEKSLKEILIRPSAVYEKSNVQFNLGVRVESILRDEMNVQLIDGNKIPYDKLVLTTGSRVRKLTIPGSDLAGLCYLRSISDVNQIREFSGSGKKIVIIGGGYIGLEAAAALKKLGMKVTVLEAMDRVLQRITTQEISGFYTRVHNEEGVNIEVNAVAASIEGTGQVEKVICQDGRAFDADLIIAGIGIIPCDELAQQAGLDVDNGILVDQFSQTSDSKILAAGDCTVHYNPIYDRHIRLESVQNAVDQAKVAAATICGSPLAYKALPWFWSDQYDIKLQIAGLSQGYDQVVMRSDINTGRSFAAFYLKQGKLLAVDAINKPKEFMMGRRLIMRGNTVDPAKLADEQLPMKDLI
jgi:3-phenylpropionate/trans-cinnamate dioxygenase ferredoxin reductase subunit